MKIRYIFIIWTVIAVLGCGVGVPAYKDAILDGVSALNRNKLDKAMQKFNQAIKLDPSRSDGYLGRADVLNAMKQYDEALVDYHRAIEINPDFAQAYANRAIAYSHLNQYKKAIADYEKALELDPEIDDPPGFINRLFSNEPNTDKGIRRHLEYLKNKVESK
jgi:tetratricopeptide (TPR) repeat protein